MKSFRLVRSAVTGLIAVLVLVAWMPAVGAPTVVLDRTSPWRVMESLDWPLLATANGPASMEGKDPLNIRDELNHPPRLVTVYPPAVWADADFDDANWLRTRRATVWTNGELDPRANGGGQLNDLFTRQISLRGKFAVSDPAAVKNLTLTLVYRGGVVVWLNGREVTRTNLPAGKIAPGAPAEIYPEKAYLKEDGRPYNWYKDGKNIITESYPLRVRKLEQVTVPVDLLRKGVNVLAIEIHGAPYPEAIKMAKNIGWGTCGFCDVQLQADSGQGLTPNVARPAGLQAWNAGVLDEVRDVEYGDPNESLRPVSISGVRNGVFAGRVVVGCDKPIRMLHVQAADLVNADGRKIPSAAVEVGYGKFGPNGCRGIAGACYPNGSLTEEAILSSPPEADAKRAAAVQPVWLNVHVPRVAAPGSYKGALTLTCEGEKPVEVPIEVRVRAWTLPDPADFNFVLGLIQSPDGVAQAYGVEPWSDKHVALMGKSFDLIGKLGNGMRVLYLPLIAETQFGNPQSMVLWVKGADGTYTYDTSRLEKYIDVALAKMGQPRFTVVGVWDFGWSWKGNLNGRLVNRFSVLDPATGKVENQETPVHGTPEAAAFWKPVLTSVHAILARKKLDDTLLLGFISDAGDPSQFKTVGKVFHDILPNAGWQAVHHVSAGRNELVEFDGGSVPVRYQANVYGFNEYQHPEIARAYGWKYPLEHGLRTWYPRDLADGYSACRYWMTPEPAVLSNRRGLGHFGADFWGTIGKDGRFGKLIDRYPATTEGNLAVYVSKLLYPGPDGAVPTVGYVLMRDNIQQTETRIFLEKLLQEKPQRLKPELAAQIQTALDERTRWLRMLTPGYAPHHGSMKDYLLAMNWEERTDKLYRLAAEAAKTIGSDLAEEPGKEAKQ